MTNVADRMIVPAEFPELKALVWNRDPARGIPAKEAFALYERNWRFVDRERLSENEAHLVEELAHAFGRGRLLV